MEITTHKNGIQAAARVAQHATCERSKCGSVIVKDGAILGAGYNSPPAHDEASRRCAIRKDVYDQKVTDKTCCIHAEQRAILDALAHHGEKIRDATLYFARLAPDGSVAASGAPYCTICSKMALDVGIKYFVLLHENGPQAYETRNYNEQSFSYQAKS